MTRVALIGYGYWGVNLLRNLASMKQYEIALVCDSRQERLDVVSSNYPGIKTTISTSEVFNDPTIHAVVIATPVYAHYNLAKIALQSGKHVLVEKPLTASSAEAEELIKIAEENNLILQVDHTFLYSGSVQKIKELVKSGELGELRYFDSTRINLGLIQSDINVLWDLAPHDLSILYAIKDRRPSSVSAIGVSHTNNNIETMAYLTLTYDDGFIAHFNCSWASPVKVRTTLIGGSDKMIVYNDLHNTEKVKIYDAGFDCRNKSNTNDPMHSFRVDYRNGDIFTPKLSMHEPLQAMLLDFAQSVETGKSPVSNSQVGLDVVRVLEAAQLSIKLNGKQVKL